MNASDPKSTLLRLHRVLMVMAIALGVLFTAWSARAYHQRGEARQLIIAGATLVFTVVLTGYLRWFVKKNQPRL